MSLSKDDILEIMQKAKDLGMTRVKAGDIELSLPEISADEREDAHLKNLLAEKINNRDFDPAEVFKSPIELDNLTEEELLYYATPRFDELQALKKEAQQKIQESLIHD